MLDTKALAEATANIVREHVKAAVEPLLARIASLEAREIPIPVKGDPGEPGRDGLDGKDADFEAVRGVIAAMVESVVADRLPAAVNVAVDALPIPEKGEKGDAGEPGQAGEPGRDGKDGIGLAGMMIDRDGEAVATLTDGKLIKLGPIVGRDGKDGQAGADGKDGRDGRDLEDIQVVQDGSTIEFAFLVGETRTAYEIVLPTGPAGENGKDAYPGEARGLFKADETYRAMDVVSFNGSEWRAKRDNPGELPGDGWMLSAVRGKRGDRGEQGPPGREGKSGTSLVAAYAEEMQLILTNDDGTEHKVDLSDLAREIRGA